MIQNRVFFKLLLILLILLRILLILNSERIEVDDKNISEGPGLVLVTAFYDIGVSKSRTIGDYSKWMETFRFIINHVVFFTDSQEMINQFRTLRGGRPTSLLLYNRSELFGFKHIDEIQKIFDHPDNINMEKWLKETNYSAIMHSKCGLIRKAMELYSNLSSYFAWVDSGLFRHDKIYADFEFKANRYIENTRLLVSQSYDFYDLSINKIHQKSYSWVAGGIFAGHVSVLHEFCKVYEDFFLLLLSRNIIATDEQLIMSLYTTEGRRLYNNTVKLSVFQCDYFGLYNLISNMTMLSSCF